MGDGAAVLVHPAPTEQGYSIRTAGTRRRLPEDFDGLTLTRMRAAPKAKETQRTLRCGRRRGRDESRRCGPGAHAQYLLAARLGQPRERAAARSEAAIARRGRTSCPSLPAAPLDGEAAGVVIA
ncbi:type I-E CRISPR-associated endoribonuclease Cas2 [Streptomyces sp. NEAU-sy36]|uniref:type I-E CRISPR-associated endoribonuclease Cas2 n=1 Tax=unclassified Streptomyces TaxID=2593676 RepID=UPI0035A6DC8E